LAKIYADADEVRDYPERIRERSEEVTSDSKLQLQMAPGGGFVVHFASR
jgi:hypothetical protein